MEEQNQKIYVVSGIAFTDIKQAKFAQIEQKRIEILNSKLDYNDVNAVALLYKKARDNRSFQTPVGISYMVRLHDWLVKKNYEGIDELYVVVENLTEDTGGQDELENGLLTERDELWKSRLEKQAEKEKELRRKYNRSVLGNVLLVILVIVLFVISQTGNNPTILNYKTKIINQYTRWEQELEQREAAVEQKEAELGISGEAE